MSPERLAEIKKNHEQDCRPEQDQGWLDNTWEGRMVRDKAELIDALTAERELAKRAESQIRFQCGLVAEATGHSFHPPERKTDLDAVLTAVRDNRDKLASANLRAEKAVELAEDLFTCVVADESLGADEIKGWADRLVELDHAKH